MISFLIRKIIQGILIILGVAIVVFLIFQVLPGDPVSMMMGQRSDVSSREAVIREYGLDKPLPQQFIQYLNDLSPVSFHEKTAENQQKYNYSTLFSIGSTALTVKQPYMRRSFQSNRKVTAMISEAFAGTTWLTFTAMIFATLLGITIGIVAAIKKDTWIDRSLITVSVIGISAPSFVAGTLIAYVFAFLLHDFTGLKLTGYLWEINPEKGYVFTPKNLILPAFTLGIRPLAIIVQLMRSAMLDVMQQDFVRTAYAKGLSSYRVIVKHILPNALNPVITAISGWFASLLAGTFFIEYIFDWKGLGLLTINAVFSLDFPVVMGATLTVACLFVLINLFVDLLYAIVDPRIKL